METSHIYRNAKDHFIALIDEGKLECIVTPNYEAIDICHYHNGIIKSSLPTDEVYNAVIPYLGYPVIEVRTSNDGKSFSNTKKFLHAVEMLKGALLFKTTTF